MCKDRLHGTWNDSIYILGQQGIMITNSVYTDSVALEFLLTDDQIETIKSEIIEGTNGQAGFEVMETCYFAKIDNEMKIL